MSNHRNDPIIGTPPFQTRPRYIYVCVEGCWTRAAALLPDDEGSLGSAGCARYRRVSAGLSAIRTRREYATRARRICCGTSWSSRGRRRARRRPSSAPLASRSASASRSSSRSSASCSRSTSSARRRRTTSRTRTLPPPLLRVARTTATVPEVQPSRGAPRTSFCGNSPPKCLPPTKR